MDMRNLILDTSEDEGPTISNQPVPAGDYPAVIKASSYDLTRRDIVYDKEGALVRAVYDYEARVETPITAEEKARGCKVDKSGTYLWLGMHVTLPDGSERQVNVRPNIVNCFKTPRASRAAVKEIQAAIGIPQVQFVAGSPVEALHDKRFIVCLSVKEKRNQPGENENELRGAKPLAGSGLKPGQIVGGAVVESVISSRGPAKPWNDENLPF
jgi:hypothetical protein